MSGSGLQRECVDARINMLFLILPERVCNALEYLLNILCYSGGDLKKIGLVLLKRVGVCWLGMWYLLVERSDDHWTVR